MGLYKVEIKPLTSFIGNITSNTLFGAFCFAIRDLYGEEILSEVFSDGAKGIVLSNLFPHNTLPSSINANEFEDIHTKEIIRLGETNQNAVHALIGNRTGEYESLTVKWEEIETWSKLSYDFYIYTELFDKSDIEKIINLVLTNGLGKGRNRGKGQFELVGMAEVEHIINPIENSNGYMTLSDYIPNTTDSTIGSYTSRIYQGATGGIKKSPIYLINAGSKFMSNDRGRNVDVIGRLHKDPITNTYTCGLALTIPVRI